MIQQANDQNLEEILKNNENIIIKFQADWCGICKAIAPEFEKIAEQNSENVSFFEINAPDNPKARMLAGVYSLPFFASFKNGELVEKMATSDKKKILSMIKEVESLNPELH
ncbi:thiol reductase thioredoxin [Marivirga lumbricoides]|uniref:Thioredoxin n=1 Tax=Marivirga lumbricoides TaxID=1046115 RepID=A0ABQ1LXI2_9BACT|nr:thiol reductase thioredoxin [Marivirga lumbricoides]